MHHPVKPVHPKVNLGTVKRRVHEQGIQSQVAILLHMMLLHSAFDI